MPVDLLVMLVMIHNVSLWAVQREGGQKLFLQCVSSSDDFTRWIVIRCFFSSNVDRHQMIAASE